MEGRGEGSWVWRAERSAGPLGSGENHDDDDAEDGEGKRAGFSGPGSRSRLDLISPIMSPRGGVRSGGATPGRRELDRADEQSQEPSFRDDPAAVGFYNELEDAELGHEFDEEEDEEEHYVDESEMRHLVLGRVGGWVDWAVGWAVDFHGDDGAGREEDDNGDEGGGEVAGADGGGMRAQGRRTGAGGAKVAWEHGEDGEEGEEGIEGKGGVGGIGGLDINELDRRLAASSITTTSSPLSPISTTATADSASAAVVAGGAQNPLEGGAEDGAQGGWVRDARWLLRVAGGGGGV